VPAKNSVVALVNAAASAASVLWLLAVAMPAEEGASAWPAGGGVAGTTAAAEPADAASCRAPACSTRLRRGGTFATGGHGRVWKGISAGLQWVSSCRPCTLTVSVCAQQRERCQSHRSSVLARHRKHLLAEKCVYVSMIRDHNRSA